MFFFTIEAAQVCGQPPAVDNRIYLRSSTPPKINIEPENDGLDDVSPFPGCILRFHVNLPGCTPII